MSKKRKLPRLAMKVMSGNGLEVPQAKITLVGPAGKIQLTPEEFADSEKLKNLPKGKYKAFVKAQGYLSQSREIEIGEEVSLEPFFLGKRGQKSLYRGKISVPVDAPENQIGLLLDRTRTGSEFDSWLQKQAKRLRLGKVQIQHSGNEGNATLKLEKGISKFKRRRLMALLRRNEAVSQAGAQINPDNKNISFLTNQMAVVFKPELKRETVHEVLAKFKLKVLFSFIGVPHGYQVEISDSSFHEPLEISQQLMKTGLLLSASVEGYSEAEEDVIPPTDAMFAEQWHIPVVNLQGAWAALRATNPPPVLPGTPGDKSYGDENMIISIVDGGIHTFTPPGGTPVSAHHDYAGNVTSGNPKLAVTADFTILPPRMNNDTPTSNHGMGCAGAALANSNHQPMNGAISEGIVGAAPNIRAMGIIRTGATANMLQMYLWSAGLPTGNRNLPQLARGIDISSNSWGWTLAALPAAAALWPLNVFRPMTLFGRKGRGTLLFFSTGNVLPPSTTASTQRPFSTDQLTFGVGASSLNTLPPAFANEIRAGYSCFGSALGGGTEIDFVAPSQDAYVAVPPPPAALGGLNSWHNPNNSFGAISNTLHDQGFNAAGNQIGATTLNAATAAPLNQITLAPMSSGNSSRFFGPGRIVLLDPGGANMGAYYILARNHNAITNVTTLTFNVNVPAGVGAGTNVVGLHGNLPGSAAPVATTLTAPTGAASPVIQVNDTAGLIAGQAIYFGAPNTPLYQAAIIQRVNGHNHLTLTANVGAVHPINTPVVGATSLTGTVQSVPAIAPPAAASTTFQVNSITGLVAGQLLHIGALGAGTAEVVTITGTAPTLAPAVNPTVTVTPQVRTAHAITTPWSVVGGRLQTQIGGGAAPVVGATSISVTSSAGFQIGQAILIGNPGGGAGNVDYNVVRSIPNGTTINLGRQLVNGHANGTNVRGGSASYTTNFGGTSFSTPLAAGIAGLVLSGNPNLTWIEVKDILRGTATRIVPGDPSWTAIAAPHPQAGRFYSNLFGYGRVNAQAAVAAAIAYNHNQRDLMIRNTLLDTGGTETPADSIINSPDIWVRNTNPTAETTAVALPAAANVAGPHQKPVRGANRWIYIRVSNRGTTLAGLQAWLRVYIAISDGLPEFSFPDAWVNLEGNGTLPNSNSNLFQLNTVAAAPNLNGTSLFSTPAQPQMGGPIPALAGGIPAGGNHVLRYQWNQADVPSLPLTYRFINTFAATIAADRVIHLDNTTGLTSGQSLLFLTPGTLGHRRRIIQSVDSPTRVTLTAIINRAFPPNTRVIPISPTVATTFNGASGVGAGASDNFNVNDASAFKLGQHILLGNPGTAGSEIVTITDLTVNPAGNDSLTVTPANATNHANGRAITLVSDPLRTFVVAEVTPHDGLLAGENFRNNNNISYKEVNLRADLNFTDAAAANPLTNSVTVDETGTAVTTNFRMNMVDGEGFTIDHVSIKVTRHHTDPTNNETVTYRLNGGAWNFDTAPAGNWVTCAAPLTTSNGNPAVGPETGVHFNGTFAVDNNHNKVTFIAIHNPPAPAAPLPLRRPIQVKYHEVAMFTLPPGSSNLGLTQSKKPKFHIWTDMALINDQAQGDGYGPDDIAVSPDPTNKFNLTSLFTAPAAANVPAYATVTGTVFIQRNTTDANKVNLFLKPLHQSKVGFTPVKYFVYRGLKLTDFLKGTSNADEVKARANDATASEFIKYVYAVYDQLRTDATAPAADLASKALGWDPPNQVTLTTSVDRYFYATDPNFQLPIVSMGMQLGEFHVASGKFGFEIILEEGTYSPDLANARLSNYQIDLTVGALTANQQKAKREEILNYIDPAAYYGMHFQIGVRTNDAASPIKKENDLFTASMAKYITRDKVYIDIRNESGYSYHYYSNYDDGSGNQVQIGDESAAVVAAPYHTHNWPVIIHDANIPVAKTNTPVFLTLRVNDNKKPLVYVEWTELTTASKADKFVSGTDLNTAGGVAWTKPMGFVTPNVVHPTDGTRRIHISQVVKINYFRELDATTVWPATVFKTESHLANVFGPLEAPELFTAPADDIEWVSAQDKRFIDNSGAAAADKFAYVAERGVAQEDSRVIYWASASEQYDVAGNSYSNATGVTAGTSTKGNFFEVAYMFRGLRLEIEIVKEQTSPGVHQEVKTLKLKTTVANQMSAKNLLVLGITEAEATLLKNVAGFAPEHERNVVLVEDGSSPFTDPDGKQFRKYRLRVAGLNPALNYFVADPASNVHVYSTDRHFFCSKDFGAAQPQPTYYGPSMEERIPDVFLEKTGPILALDATTESLVNDFTALVAAVTNDANAKTTLSNLATSNFGLLWAHSAAFANISHDNRPYFIARNKMRHELRRHPYYLGKDAERDTATTLLENLSRNYTGTSFPAANKKILVIGLDCNALLFETANPASTTALALHGDTITSGAINGTIQSMVFPLRYEDYDKHVLRTHLHDFFHDDSIDMVILVGEDHNGTTFNLERIASRKRGGDFDNRNQKEYNSIGTTAAFKQFFETNAPIATMHPGPFPGSPGQWLYYNEAAESVNVVKNSPLASASPGANGNANSYALNTLTGDARSGSSGDFIPNEVYYRLCQLRDAHSSTVKVGMISIPPIDKVTGGAITMAQAVQRVKDIITLALPSL